MKMNINFINDMKYHHQSIPKYYWKRERERRETRFF